MTAIAFINTFALFHDSDRAHLECIMDIWTCHVDINLYDRWTL